MHTHIQVVFTDKCSREEEGEEELWWRNQKSL